MTVLLENYIIPLKGLTVIILQGVIMTEVEHLTVFCQNYRELKEDGKNTLLKIGKTLLHVKNLTEKKGLKKMKNQGPGLNV
ncbi:MAG: hypothetical protein LBC67_02450 [Spirochaetales bacterium]|nr:hypothetical protein [Spirochaetales bacterium]